MAGRMVEVMNGDVFNSNSDTSNCIDNSNNWYRFAEEVLDTCVLSVLEGTLDGEGL